MTKFEGGFLYYLDDIKLKNYDAWEKAIKNIEVITEIIDLEVRAKKKQKNKDG